ncbi:hypothetical protein ARMGADRAFT_1075228 [Armillaria gallica]|uniref:Uncharacterized protein n=1 Tax=Armillaria gallica TaxID=47427 RepID=A0A2H3DT32_ARMGA|nr:hypothetical protein ARMGADRAFT_1075228 [Armillaria gallica]
MSRRKPKPIQSTSSPIPLSAPLLLLESFKEITGVDDEYTDTPKRAKTAKSGPSKRRAKEAVEEETEEEKKARLAKDRKKAWKEEVKKMVPWEYNSSFVIPQGTETITKSKAKETYELNDRDLDSLPYEQQLAASGFKMKLYSLRDVKDICRRKNGPELIDEAENLVEYLTKSHDETGAPITRIARLTKTGRDILGEREENEARENRLTDCLTLWVPDYAETPASYEPPTFECTKPSLPNNFAMRPGSRLITELEAMNLFLRAMDCHGGFDGHNRKVLDLSNDAVSKNYWDWGTYPEDLMIEFALSPIALKKSRKTSELDDRALLEVWWPPYDPIGDELMRKTCAPGHCDGCRTESAPDLSVVY